MIKQEQALDFDDLMESVTGASGRERARLVTVAEEAEQAHRAYALGMRQLSEERYGAALRWLRIAVTRGLDDVQPMVDHCATALADVEGSPTSTEPVVVHVRRRRQANPPHHYSLDGDARSDGLDGRVSLPPARELTGAKFTTTVKAATTGDPVAVEEVLAAVVPIAVRYCRARLGGRELSYLAADDVAQEVCLAVLHALPHHRGGPFLRLVHGIAARKVANAERLNGIECEDPARRPSVSALLRTLPPLEREIVLLRIVVGLSAEETGEALGVSPGRVRVSQHHALAKLRERVHGPRPE